MMISLCEFIICGVMTGVSGVYHVIGRCGDIGFRVGEVFDQLEHPQYPTQSVRLRIIAIHAYQHSLEELGAGMTASIDVQGEGVEFLRPNAILVISGNSADVSAAAASQTVNNE